MFFVWPSKFHTFTKVQFKHLDYAGIVLIMVGTVLPVFIINQAAVKVYAWNSATTICVLVLSGFTWIFLMIWEWQLSKKQSFRNIRPQLPFRLLTDRAMASVFV